MTNAVSQEADQAMPGVAQAPSNAPAQAMSDAPRQKSCARPQGKPEVPRVDMLAIARDAQWSADTFLGPGSLKLVAPAKVNLCLHVGERRPDGYHNVVNVMHAVALHDVLYVNRTFDYESPAQQASIVSPSQAEDTAGKQAEGAAQQAEGAAQQAEGAAQQAEGAPVLPAHLAYGGPQDNLLVSVDVSDRASAAIGAEPLRIPARSNIVFKAIDALACTIGYTEHERISVRIEKNIPHQGGLGGGSSDAAAVLVALARYWGLEATSPEVVDVAQRLGSDVAFFLYGGCALFTGTGEVLEHALSPRKDALVLVKPPVGVSTPAAYRTFDEDPLPAPEGLLSQVAQAAAASDVPLYNNLAPASEKLAPELAEVRTWLAARPGVAGPQDVLLCGSGATTFAVVRDAAAACDIVAAARARGWWARATTFSSLRAAQVPRR